MRLDLSLTKDHRPKRLVFYCPYDYKWLAQEAGRGTGRFSKKDKAWTYPVEPLIVKHIKEQIPDVEIGDNLKKYLDDLADKQRRVLRATENDAPLDDSSLWDFQRASVRFLNEVGKGILGHEMGTGKTPIAASAIDYLTLAKVIVICPNAVKWSWVNHIKEWAGREDIYVVEPKKGKDKAENGVISGTKDFRGEEIEKLLFKNREVILVMNYEQARIHSDTLKQFDIDAVISDEAHRLKNRKARRTQEISSIVPSARFLWLCTGTVFRNSYDDIYSLLNMCDPVRFSGYWNFVNFYLDYVEHPFGGIEIIGPKDENEFSHMLATYMFRVTKKDVMPSLPDKIITEYPIPLSEQQKKDYDSMEKELMLVIEKELDDGKEIEEIIRAENVVSQMIRLRQICLSSRLLGSNDASAKLDFLDEILDDVCFEGNQVIIFTYFREFAEAIKELVEDKGISYGCILGGQTSQQRDEVEQSLNSGEVQVVIATAQSGGEGMNLQKASTAIFTDVDWVPYNNIQAEDRIHRGEIKESPNIIRIYHPGTIEDDIRSVCRLKERSFNTTTGQAETVRRMVNRKGE